MGNIPQTPHPQAQTDRHEEENPNQEEDIDTVMAIAEAAYEAIRPLQRHLGDPVNPPWAEAGRHLKDSILDGVRAILRGEVTEPGDSHRNWLAFKESEGWTYGDVKDFEAKTHPCIVPFDELPEHQQVKNHLFFNVVTTMSRLM